MAKILVIDDDKYVRASIRAVLDGAGHGVSDVGGADEGIALQKRASYDLVIVDLIMPGKEGLETIRELHVDFPHLPIIAISGGGGFVRKNYVSAAELFGACATLEKPFDGDELLAKVADVLAQSTSVKAGKKAI